MLLSLSHISRVIRDPSVFDFIKSLLKSQDQRKFTEINICNLSGDKNRCKRWKIFQEIKSIQMLEDLSGG